MTEAAYQQEVASEKEPAAQAYKGYVVDTKLKSATIYIDEENHVALAKVSYTQTQLQKRRTTRMLKKMCCPTVPLGLAILSKTRNT